MAITKCDDMPGEPSNVDPSREHAWQSLEHQREYGDIVSAVRSAIPGAAVAGDYVIENRDSFSVGRGNDAEEGGHGHWWTTFFLFHMIGATEADGDLRPRSRALARHRRPPVSERRVLGGENLSGLLEDDNHDDDDRDDGVHIISDGKETSSNPRRRRA